MADFVDCSAIDQARIERPPWRFEQIAWDDCMTARAMRDRLDFNACVSNSELTPVTTGFSTTPPKMWSSGALHCQLGNKRLQRVGAADKDAKFAIG